MFFTLIRSQAQAGTVSGGPPVEQTTFGRPAFQVPRFVGSLVQRFTLRMPHLYGASSHHCLYGHGACSTGDATPLRVTRTPRDALQSTRQTALALAEVRRLHFAYRRAHPAAGLLERPSTRQPASPQPGASYPRSPPPGSPFATSQDLRWQVGR